METPVYKSHQKEVTLNNNNELDHDEADNEYEAE